MSPESFGTAEREPPLLATSRTSNGSLYVSTRHASFHPEVRRRILLGTYTLSSAAMDNYFIRAQRVRRLVSDDFNAIFTLPNILKISDDTQSMHAPDGELKSYAEHKGEACTGKVDVLITPTAPTLPPTLASIASQTPLEAYATDVFTVPASLAGLPAVSVPVGIDAALARTEYEGQPLGEGNEFKTPTSAGIQIIAQYGDDELCLSVAEMLDGIAVPAVPWTEMSDQGEGIAAGT